MPSPILSDLTPPESSRPQLPHVAKISVVRIFGAGRKIDGADSGRRIMHVTWLMGATQIFAGNRDKWRGTVVAVFRPGACRYEKQHLDAPCRLCVECHCVLSKGGRRRLLQT
jgi:hypothetical protein